ncbi:MAG: family transposase [Pseudarthrobacter sp.]|nr:family transposase [Pseudarthrobacter sp.]
MLGVDEHRYRSVRFFRDPATKAWKFYEPWMTAIVDLDTGRVLGIVDGRDSEGVGDWLFAVLFSGAWACRSLPSIRPRRSARLCGCGCRAPLFRSTRFIWSSWATPCSPKSGNGSRGRFMAGGGAPSTLSRRTGGCSCTPGTHSRTGPGTGSAPCSPQMTPPGSCRPRGWSRNSSGLCCPPGLSPTLPPRKSGCRLKPCSRNEPALAHGLQVVERDRSPHCHRSDNCQSGSQQHRDRAHKGTGPEAITVLDAFHVVKLGSAMVDEVHRRFQQDTLGHRGRTGDPLYGILRTLQTGPKTSPTNRGASDSMRNSPSGPRPRSSPPWHWYEKLRNIYHSRPERGRELVAAVIAPFPTCPISEVARPGRTLKHPNYGRQRFWPTSRPTAPPMALPKRSTASSKPPTESPAASATSPTTDLGAYSRRRPPPLPDQTDQPSLNAKGRITLR